MEAGLGVFSRSFRPPEDSCVLDSTPNRFVTRRTKASKFWECYVGTWEKVRTCGISRRMLKTGHPTRPQVRENRRRSLWATLRILSNREQSWGPFSASCRGRLALDDYIARNFAAWTEGLLRFAIEFGLDATGITEGQNKLVLAFPSGPLSRP